MEKAFQKPIDVEQEGPRSWKSQSIAELAKALAKAQGEMGYAKKDSTNPHFKNRYADIASVIEAIREPLSKNGLSYVQYVESEAQEQYLVTMLMHSSGDWLSSRLKLIAMKNDMQGVGGALTYARRYSLSAMVGIAQDDDDGETASGRVPTQQHTLPTAPVVNKPVTQLAKVGGPSDAQLKRLFAISKQYDVSQDQLKDYLLEHFNKSSTKDLTIAEYEKICADMQSLYFVSKNVAEEPPMEDSPPPVAEPLPWEKYLDQQNGVK